MKIPRSGLLWFLIVGIPALFLCCVGMICFLIHFTWLEDICMRWVQELNGGGANEEKK